MMIFGSGLGYRESRVSVFLWTSCDDDVSLEKPDYSVGPKDGDLMCMHLCRMKRTHTLEHFIYISPQK